MGLREELERATNLQPDVAGHLTAVQALQSKYPHRVVFVQQGNPLVNCFMYALGIAPYSIPPMKTASDNRLGLGNNCLAEALTFLACHGVIKRREAEDVELLVLYSHDGRLLHAGRPLGAGRYCSKWGKGAVWEHGLLELPDSYGDRFGYWTAACGDQIERALLVLAWERGTLPDAQRDYVKGLLGDATSPFGTPVSERRFPDD
jgi:hypothetical protein